MATSEAVIEIGSTGVRLLVAEFTQEHKRNILDRSEMPVALGRDVFTSGSISRETQAQILKILERYKEQLVAWNIEPSLTTVIATSAFREAKNKDPVMDKILSATGYRVKVIDGIEENRLMYLAVTDCLKSEALTVRSEDSVILEVGGSSTEIMLMKKGKMAGAHSLRLGTTRLELKTKAQYSTSFDDVQRYIQEYALNAKSLLESELNLSEVKQFIAVGADATLAAIHSGKPVSTFLWSIDRNDFDRFVNEIQGYSVDECVARFKISYNDAQTLRVSLLIYNMFVHHTNCKNIIVPETNIREGVIISHTDTAGDELQDEFHQQITASAISLLRKYHGDERHAERVRSNALAIFRCLEKEISLEDRSIILLEVASILHDIGIFIRMDDHNLHSEYIIRHSEIFGITRTENLILSLIARYHRGKQMPQDNEQFPVFARSDRMTILKLTAILRLADALDRSHGYSLKGITVQLKDDSLIIKAKGSQNLSLERIALKEKGDLFESVFGYKVVLL